MTRRRSASQRRAQGMGRPKGNARVIQDRSGNAYEVRRTPEGTLQVFRLELLYVEPGTPEYRRIEQTLTVLEHREAVARGEIEPGAPRPVPPHTPGVGS